MNHERIYLIEEADPAVFFGTNSRNLSLLKELFPKLRIMARGNLVKVLGETEEMSNFIRLLHALEKYAAEYNVLPETTIIEMSRGERPERERRENVIVYSTGGKPIVAKSENQAAMVRLIEEKDLVFATGPAGTGKTFIAIAMAVKYLKSKQARRIILSRPAVEAGEKLGFLPGEMKDKLDPYLQPLYDALIELIPAARLREYMESEVIQIAPLAFMRGRTLNDAFIILDEAQNTTTHQMKMFLTRLGENAKMVVTGDMSQIDLPRGVMSGIRQAKSIVSGIEGVGWIEYEQKDIMRHRLVQEIVTAYEAHEMLRQEAKRNKDGEE
ncbi:MAG: PhoH family protein [Porphyromonas sp.]|nr:PhoH family protein [Porphyromonas sp.]